MGVQYWGGKSSVSYIVAFVINLLSKGKEGITAVGRCHCSYKSHEWVAIQTVPIRRTWTFTVESMSEIIQR
jgi:hypothetical protein